MATQTIFNPLIKKRFQEVNIADAASVNTTNVLFVSKGGDDTLAAAASGGYDMAQPWLNPTVAMAAASSGDTVFVYPGTYTIGTGGDVTDDGLQQLVRDGVLLYLMSGVEINYTNLTGTASVPFTDGGVASTFTVRGNGKLVFNRNLTGGPGQWLVTTNDNSTVDFEVDEIDTRLRWGGTDHRCLSWRMVGRKYLQRESMVFAFRFDGGTSAARFVDFEFDELEIRDENLNNIWTRMELRSFRAGSIANIKFGTLTWTNGFVDGGLYQTTGSHPNSTINIDIGQCTRTGGLANIHDHLIRGVNHRSRGNINIRNIRGTGGFARYSGVSSTSVGKRIENYEGVILDGYTGGSFIFLYDGRSEQSDVYLNLNVDFEATNAFFRGVIAHGVDTIKVSGHITMAATTTTNVFRVAGSVGPVGPQLVNLRMTCLNGVPCIENGTAGIVAMRVINSYATEPISLANGGVNQLIETVTIDPNV